VDSFGDAGYGGEEIRGDISSLKTRRPHSTGGKKKKNSLASPEGGKMTKMKSAPLGMQGGNHQMGGRPRCWARAWGNEKRASGGGRTWEKRGTGAHSHPGKGRGEKVRTKGAKGGTKKSRATTKGVPHTKARIRASRGSKGGGPE